MHFENWLIPVCLHSLRTEQNYNLKDYRARACRPKLIMKIIVIIHLIFNEHIPKLSIPFLCNSLYKKKRVLQMEAEMENKTTEQLRNIRLDEKTYSFALSV